MDAAINSETSAIRSALRYKIIAVVGQEHVRAATLLDTIAGVQPKIVVEPGTEGELAEVLRLSAEAGLAVIPRGGGTKLSWGNPPSGADLVLSTAGLDEIIEHAWADLTVTVESGCTIQRLQDTLAQHGQKLALDPLYPEKATVGGILSTNDSGALRLRFGALRDLIIGVTIALPDGTLASSGGKVVKNVAGYDLPKLVTGAWGSLGVITRAIFRLHPLPRHTRSFSFSSDQPEEAMDAVLAIQDSKLAHTALQSQFSGETQPISDILFEGTEAGLDAQSAQLCKLCPTCNISEASPDAWAARQKLWAVSREDTACIAKVTSLPAEIAKTARQFARAAEDFQLKWKALMYATGIGWLRLEGSIEAIHGALGVLRSSLESRGGSLVVLRRPEKMSAFDAWGSAGDALPLMKAVKLRLDPQSTLNPGRFVGGI